MSSLDVCIVKQRDEEARALPSAVAVVVSSSGRVGFATTASLRSKGR